MTSPDTAADLAKEFFSLANVIAGFYVAQTLLFLNSLTKEAELRTFLCRDLSSARKVTWGICCIYLAAVIVCLTAELTLRVSSDQSCAVVCTSLFVGIGRVLLITAISQGCTMLFSYITPPPCSQSTEEATPKPK